jgi:hypothetical protein
LVVFQRRLRGDEARHAAAVLDEIYAGVEPPTPRAQGTCLSTVAAGTRGLTKHPQLKAGSMNETTVKSADDVVQFLIGQHNEIKRLFADALQPSFFRTGSTAPNR